MRADVHSICDIMPSVAALLGVPHADDRIGLRARLDEPDRVLVVLIDGLGLHLLPRLAGSAPLLADVLAGSVGRLDELRCTFPSTTPTSLASLGTGVGPGAHGVLGFTVNVPGTDRVLTHIAWQNDPPLADWVPVHTWFGRAAAAGVGSTAVLPAAFEHTGLTRAVYGGAAFDGLGRQDDNAAVLLDRLRRAPGIVFGYTSVLDTAAHEHGIASPQWQRAAADVDALLTRLVEGLPRGATLLVTADHGGLDLPALGRYDVGTDHRLSDGVHLVAGEPRVRYLHVQPGAQDDVLATWREVLGDGAQVQSRGEAIAAGRFGVVNPSLAARIGDVVVTCRGATAVMASGWEPKETLSLVGFHGSDSPAETAIPLITFSG